MGQRSIRFPDELEARLAALAEADGRTFSNYVLRTLEKALGNPYAGPIQIQGTPIQPRGSEPEPGPATWANEMAAKHRQPSSVKPAAGEAKRLGKGFVPPRPKGK